MIIIMLILTSCDTSEGGYNIIDTTYHFDYAIIELPSGRLVEGEVQSWRDYQQSDQIQVKIDDITYLTHISNVVLVSSNNN